jgi:hypothetical protein
VYISTGSVTPKTIIINNLEGKILYQGTTAKETCLVNVATFNNGIYFATVIDNESGQVAHLKFIKK